MWNIIRRAVFPAILLIGGLASLIYGAKFHFVPVLAEEKIETTIDLPATFPQGPRSLPGTLPWNEPPRSRQQVIQKTTFITLHESEPAMIREVSVGGAALDESNEIKRTYSGKAPALCPT